jgi:transcriptional repressor NrdR
MKVIKKDGSLQNFDIKKVLLSVERASDDANQPMNESDVENVINSIKDRLFNLKKDAVEAELIRDVVIGELQSLGFSTVAEFYMKGKGI